MPMVVTLCTFLAIVIMSHKHIRGIALGLISYIVISVFCGDFKKIKGSSWVIGGLFSF